MSWPAPIRLAALGLMTLGVALCAPACGPSGDSDTEGDSDSGSEPAVAVCGDGACIIGENCESCEADCGACSDNCYDGVCAFDEGCSNCPSDCGPGCPTFATTGPDGTEVVEPDVGFDNWPPEWVALELEMLELVNAIRASGTTCASGPRPAVSPLSIDAALSGATRRHAWDMGSNGYFDHQSLNGDEPSDRMDDAGYTGFPRAENIAAGNEAAATTFEQWHTSDDGHCENMMLADIHDIGIGYARVDESPYRHYWVQNFGRR